MAAEKYRKLFPLYKYKFLDAVNHAVTACNFNFIFRKEQLQALYEYTRGRDVVINLLTSYGKSICYSLCPLCPFVSLVLLPKNTEVSHSLAPYIPTVQFYFSLGRGLN